MRRFSRAGIATLLVLAATGIAAPRATALDDGLARTPPMGFNDWNAFGCNVSEQLIKDTADIFVESGLKDAGYEYVNIDDCWMTHSRDAQGRLVPDPVKFPDGISGTADYVHSKGLKLGIYEDAGTATCAGYPGSLGHEQIDAQTFADWGVDYLKYDNCNNAGSTTREQYIQRYSAMRDALKATGRPIVYSLCEWGINQPWEWGADVGHLWRTTGDIGDSYFSMLDIAEVNMGLDAFAGPGHWNDPDMLEVGNGGMTDTEYRSHFSLWAIMAAPLLIGTDLREATQATMDILLNKEVIAVDQDRLGIQARHVRSDGGHHVLVKPLADGDKAVALFNASDEPALISPSAAELGLPRRPAYVIRDLWAHTTRAGRIAATVPPHGTAMYRVELDRDWNAYPPAVDAGFDIEGDPKAGAEVAATTTVTNLGQVEAQDVRVELSGPDGWELEPTSPTSTRALGSDRSLETTWRVGIPTDAAPGTYELTATVSYRAGDARGLTVRRRVDVFVPPPPPPPFAAWYRFDETAGTTAADSSGSGHDAQLRGGASWTSGTIGGAVDLDGVDGHVVLPPGVITGATAYSVAAWVRLDALSFWSRIFDFGTSTNANMFLTPRSGGGTLRFAITAAGSGGEQRIDAPMPQAGVWTHVAVTYGDNTGILYVNGQEVGRNGAMTVRPLDFGASVDRNYIGRSQYPADPYLDGAVDDFRVYGRTLSAAEVAELAQAG
jgi:alpha-galactosidase